MTEKFWMHSLLNNPAHWRDRAEEVRRIAEEMRDGRAKEMLLGVAQTYDDLSRLAEQCLLTNLGRLETAPEV